MIGSLSFQLDQDLTQQTIRDLIYWSLDHVLQQKAIRVVSVERSPCSVPLLPFKLWGKYNQKMRACNFLVKVDNTGKLLLSRYLRHFLKYCLFAKKSFLLQQLLQYLILCHSKRQHLRQLPKGGSCRGTWQSLTIKRKSCWSSLRARSCKIQYALSSD